MCLMLSSVCDFDMTTILPLDKPTGRNENEKIDRRPKIGWEYYNEMALAEDNDRELEWEKSMDVILVFVSYSFYVGYYQ